uniref:Uncharacterized protein n=1 Tax=Papilio polytes TaxID=76194 RepID=I4DSD6_PAPPL|nr:unknown unsecreted protein [Papilio polytes]
MSNYCYYQIVHSNTRFKLDLYRTVATTSHTVCTHWSQVFMPVQLLSSTDQLCCPNVNILARIGRLAQCNTTTTHKTDVKWKQFRVQSDECDAGGLFKSISLYHPFL